MNYYTAVEAAEILDVSDKTIRRWLASGKLQARRIASNKLAIPETEIARLQLEREQFSTTSNQDQAQRLDDLERKYSDLERRLSALETRDLVAAPGPATGTAHKQPGPDQRELFSGDETPTDIPGGSMLYSDFALAHGISTYTFRDHLTKGIGRGLEDKDKVAHITRPIPNRREVERWLTPEQQGAAILYWQRHNKAYTPCPDCPHQQVTVTYHATSQDGDSAAREDRDQ